MVLAAAIATAVTAAVTVLIAVSGFPAAEQKLLPPPVAPPRRPPAAPPPIPPPASGHLGTAVNGGEVAEEEAELTEEEGKDGALRAAGLLGDRLWTVAPSTAAKWRRRRRS